MRTSSNNATIFATNVLKINKRSKELSKACRIKWPQQVPINIPQALISEVQEEEEKEKKELEFFKCRELGHYANECPKIDY